MRPDHVNQALIRHALDAGFVSKAGYEKIRQVSMVITRGYKKAMNSDLACLLEIDLRLEAHNLHPNQKAWSRDYKFCLR